MCIRDSLIGDPLLWHVLVQRVQIPHAVVLDDYPLHSMLELKLPKMLFGQLLFVFYGFQIHVGSEETAWMIFLLTLFAEQQQGTFAGIEIIAFQGFLYKRCLSAL